MSPAQELCLPLIGTLPEEADRETKEVAALRADAGVTASDGASICGHIITLLLPALLLLQFGTAFAVHDESASGLQWPVVSVSISMFAITCFLYHKALADERVVSVPVRLIPEIVTIIAAALIFFRRLPEAFLVMVFGMLLMAMIVVISSVHLLLYQVDDNEKASTVEHVDVSVV